MLTSSRAGLAILVPLLALSSAPARGSDAAPRMTQLARGTVARARRAIAIGPSAALVVPAVSDGADLGYSLGLGVYLFRVPFVPDPAAIQAMVVDRVKDKVKAHAQAMVREGRPAPTQEDLARYGREIVDEVEAELLGQLQRRPRLLEPPTVTMDLEWTSVPGPARWQLRATVGVGLGPVTIGPTLAFDSSGDNVVRLGPQLGLRLLPGAGPRSPVIDLFVRYDLALYDRDQQTDQIGLGARVLLDLL